MRRYLLTAAAAAAAAITANSTSAQESPTILKGQCGPPSNFATGSVDANLDEHSTPFRCNSAVITFPKYKRVLINFVLEGSKRANMIGFAGEAIEGGEVNVDHLYMNDGRTLNVTKGHCQTLWKPNGSIKSLICGARLERGDIAVATVIVFETTPAVQHRGKRR